MAGEEQTGHAYITLRVGSEQPAQETDQNLCRQSTIPGRRDVDTTQRFGRRVPELRRLALPGESRGVQANNPRIQSAVPGSAPPTMRQLGPWPQPGELAGRRSGGG